MMVRLVVPWSKDTLLRTVRREAAAAGRAPAATVIGIDDFAWRRGHSYGSIVVDLERRTVIDILPDRQRDTIIAWLIPVRTEPHPWAHSRMPMDMIFLGRSMRLFQASQQSATMSS